MIADFKAFLAREGSRMDETAFATDEPFIRAMVKMQIDLALFGIDEARRNVLALDPQAQVALTSFDEAARLAQSIPVRAEARRN